MKNNNNVIINLKGIPEFGDLLLYSFWFYFKSPKGKKAISYSVLMLAVAIIFAALSAMSRIPEWIVYWIFAASIICILSYPAGIYYSARKHFKKSRLYHETNEYIVSNEGIEFKIGNEVMKVKWNAVLKVAELKSVFIIMTPDNNTFAILKKYFTDEAEIADFVTILKRRVDNRRLRLKRY